jgi:hypothetical protein
MKQLFIAKNVAYPTSTDMSTLADGAIALVNPADGSILTAAPTSNFSIFVGRGTGKLARMFPEVDVKTLQVTKGSYEAGATFTAKITVPTPEKGSDYTVVIVKKGTVFNERSNWTFTTVATTTTAADVAKQIVDQINGNTYQLGVKATYSGGAITITATEAGKDYEVLGADALTGVAPTDVTHGKKAMYDKAYIQDLASRCAAGKGFNYLGEDGKEIYPGYPETVDADKYVLYTLRFAVPRFAAKQRDEVVYQLVHIAVPVGAPSISTLDTILGTSTAIASNLEADSSEG